MLLVWFYTWLLFAKQGYPFIFPDKGHIVPSIRGAVYYVGENITLHCYSKTTLTAGKFTFAADVDVPSQYITTINDTYIRMDKPADATDYLSTIYNCVDLVNNKVNIIGSQSVYTEYRPQNVTDILCVHFNTHDLNCSWNLGPYPYKMEPVITSPTRYLTSVKPQWGVDDQIWNECGYSSINSCTIENYNNVFVFLRVNVTNVSRRDSAISIFRVDHYVVPPTSVSNLTLKGLNSTCAVLFWRPSDNATGVKYSISYGSDEISDNRINIETASENITVCELVPFRKYTFIVQAFSNNFSSQPTTGVLIAAQDLLENVTSVTNVTCIYYDRLHVICTWSLHSDPFGQLPTKPSEVRDLTSIMPQWSVDENTWNPCSSTTLTSCTIKNFINVWVSFRVNVTNSLSHESSVTALPFLSINDFVKPAPVSKLTVRRLNASCALLTWSLNIAGMTYSISNSSDVINYENEVNTTGDNTTICNLSLFQKHTFRVQAFPQKGFPSEPVTAILNEQDGLSSEEVSGTYYIGEKITLHCHSFENFTRGTFIYGSDIEVPSNFVTIVNATYIRLDMPVDKPILPTFYYCLDKKDNSTTFVGLEQIHTEYRPQNVTNVTCTYLNKRTLYCSWSLGQNLYMHPAVPDSHSRYLTSVTPHWSSDNRQWKACINTTLTSCEIGRYNNLHVSLRVNVTNISRRESAVIEVSNLRVNDFVKPSPVEDMAVTSLSSTCTSLSWRGKMAKLSYSVSYSSPHFPDDGNNFTTQNQGITVCRLHPFRNYTFQVRAFPEKGFPSEPSTQLLQTEEDVPASGPVLTNGSYYRAPCSPKENKEQIYIYFQPIKEEDRNGNITSYLAEVSVDGQSNASDYISQDFFFNFYVACNQHFNASIYGRTKVGFSPPAKLFVPSRTLVKDLYNEKELDLKVMEMDPGVVLATWNVLDVRPFQMVIYYCKEGHSLRTCNGPMNYIVTNVMAGQHRWDSGEANLFGVAIITANNVSSGIHFTDCIYNPKVSEVSAPKEPVITKNPNFVRLSWNYDRCSRDKKIFTYSYQIRLCALLEPPSCKIYEAQGGDTTKYDLYNLTPQVNYSVFILANTTSGLSHQSAPAFFMLDPVGDQNTDSIAVEVGVVIAVMLSTLCFAVIAFYIVRKMYLNSREKLQLINYPTPHKKCSETFPANGIQTKTALMESEESGYGGSLPLSSTTEIHRPKIDKNWEVCALPIHYSFAACADFQHQDISALASHNQNEIVIAVANFGPSVSEVSPFSNPNCLTSQKSPREDFVNSPLSFGEPLKERTCEMEIDDYIKMQQTASSPSFNVKCDRMESQQGALAPNVQALQLTKEVCSNNASLVNDYVPLDAPSIHFGEKGCSTNAASIIDLIPGSSSYIHMSEIECANQAASVNDLNRVDKQYVPPSQWTEIECANRAASVNDLNRVDKQYVPPSQWTEIECANRAVSVNDLNRLDKQYVPPSQWTETECANKAAPVNDLNHVDKQYVPPSQWTEIECANKAALALDLNRAEEQYILPSQWTNIECANKAAPDVDLNCVDDDCVSASQLTEIECANKAAPDLDLNRVDDDCVSANQLTERDCDYHPVHITGSEPLAAYADHATEDECNTNTALTITLEPLGTPYVHEAEDGCNANDNHSSKFEPLVANADQVSEKEFSNNTANILEMAPLAAPSDHVTKKECNNDNDYLLDFEPFIAPYVHLAEKECDSDNNVRILDLEPLGVLPDHVRN